MRQSSRATRKVPYMETKNMKHILLLKDKYLQIEDGPARNTRARKKMKFYASPPKTILLILSVWIVWMRKVFTGKFKTSQDIARKVTRPYI